MFGTYIASGFGSYTYPNGSHIPCCGAFLYSVSKDLLTWEAPQLLRPCKQEGQFPDWEYDPAFLDPTAYTQRGMFNWHESISGSAFMYYWQACPEVDPRCRQVMRQSITWN